MSYTLSQAELLDIATACPPLETFGPDSSRPLLAFHLQGEASGLGSWLRDLPCPVIGIGFGPLAASCDVVLKDEKPLEAIAANIANTPFAAMVLVQLLRLSEPLPETAALTAESFAYATVQSGFEFKRWLELASRAEAPPADVGPPLLKTREGNSLRLTMNRPSRLNAIDVEMRDALAEGFELALLDSEVASIDLEGRGRCFSIGGDVNEFGLASDATTAHWIRTLRLPARYLPALRQKLTVHVRGAAIGAGVEIAAFAGRIVASRDAWFQLPELKYGLIPGAGGTVSLPRRIGRQRTAYLALSMRRLPAPVALGWGLVDAIEE